MLFPHDQRDWAHMDRDATREFFDSSKMICRVRQEIDRQFPRRSVDDQRGPCQCRIIPHAIISGGNSRAGTRENIEQTFFVYWVAQGDCTVHFVYDLNPSTFMIFQENPDALSDPNAKRYVGQLNPGPAIREIAERALLAKA